MKKNLYTGTFVRYGIGMAGNNYLRPVVLMKNLVSEAGPKKGQAVSEYGYSVYSRVLKRLGKLTKGDKIRFTGLACPSQFYHGLSELVFIKRAHLMNYRTIIPIPVLNSQLILGMIINTDPVRFKHVPNANELVKEYLSWSKDMKTIRKK